MMLFCSHRFIRVGLTRFRPVLELSLILFLTSLPAVAGESPQSAPEPDSRVRQEMLLAPLVGRNMHPLFLAVPPLPARRSALLEPGEQEISSAVHWGNNFTMEGLQSDRTTVDLELDSEALYSGIAWAQGLPGGREAHLGFDISWHFGGAMDPHISNFHHFFGFPDGSREIRPHYSCRMVVFQDDERILDEKGPLLPLVHLSVEVRQAILSRRSLGPGVFHLSLGVLGAQPVPVGERRHPLSANFPSGAFRLYGGYQSGPWTGEFAGGVAAVSRPAYLGSGNFHPLIVPFDATLGRALGNRASLVVTVSGSTSPFRLGYDRTDRHSATVNVGTRLALSERDVLQLSFTEEFFTFAATDIGFHLGWNRRI
ncbi:Protein of unknown function [Alkalispirochaeta americana]|uniref:DUF3187 family protein n=1 Tax=Alkalispirochaeta americana TaxID=159291 RepID=A0A1N6PUP3_9SPIO|nr:DUF3187 family protein [Alkalispirochaeta americana]SIQ08068.1 Protein of unknown function [Alkalispirochaeta americana]